MQETRLGTAMRDIQTLFSTGTTGATADARLLERFAVGSDEAAFGVLVARHGAMVLAVCRSVLRCPHDAEDAFQATFLILARKAASLHVGDSLAGWLHCVARRVAVQANIAAARRRIREQMRRASEAVVPTDDESWGEVVSILHEEIGRLPEKYRAPVLLCDLEGLTRDQAAVQLGWPSGTVAGRLARGRDLLRTRLSRRGVVSASGVAGVLLIARDASASVPPAWVETTVEAAGRFAAARGIVAGAVPVAGLALAREALNAMIRSQIRSLLLQTLALGFVLTVLFVTVATAWQKDRPGAISAKAAGVSGIVVDNDGRPAPDVKVFGSTSSQGDGWGQVIAETRTDEDGRFRLDLPAAAVDGVVPKPGALWAYRPGALVSSSLVGPGLVSPDVPVRLVLGPPGRTAFEVRGPDGKPVAGAKIRPRVLNRGILSTPNGLAERIEAETVTGADGRAVLSAFLPEEVSTVVITAPGLGSQQFGFGYRDVEIGTKVINLLPVGRIRGHLTGDAKLVRDRRLLVGTNSIAHPSPYPGLVYATTDAEGRFEVPEIPEGNLGISAPMEADSPWYIKSPPGLKVDAGQTVEVTLPLRKGVPVHGMVCEKDSGRPISGVGLSINFRDGESARTNTVGRYDAFAIPGQAHVNLWSIPPGYATLMYGGPTPTIPDDAVEFELPTIELTRAGEVRGIVVDEHDKPIAGALVEAAWPVDEGPNRRGQRETSVRSDGRGEFRLDRVPLNSEVALVARHLGMRTPEPTSTRAGAEIPPRLRLAAAQTAALGGRVVDEQGKPIAGAHVHLRVLRRNPGGQIMGDDLVDFDGAHVLTSDAEGRFRTPPQLDREREYAAFAAAQGFRTERTPWIAGESGAFPDLVLRHEGQPRR